jgi:protein-S-isoprenylcysteine O-methyltransferase Ste14
MKKFPDLPPLWTAATIAAMFVLNWAVPYFIFDFPNSLVGFGFMAIGVGLIVWSALWFKRKKTTIEPHHEATSLLIEGPYKLTRNPIYVGMVVFTFGMVMYIGNPLTLLPWLSLIWVLHTRFVIPEEKGLLKTFGKEAETYIAATRRW